MNHVVIEYKDIPDGLEDDEIEQYLKRFIKEKESIVKSKGVMYALEQLEYIAEKEMIKEYCKDDIVEISDFITQNLDYNDANRMDLILTIIVQMSLVDVWKIVINEKNITNRKVSNMIQATENEIKVYNYKKLLNL